MADFSEVRRGLEQRLRDLDRRVSRIEGDLRQPGNRDWDEKAIETENDEVLERLGQSETREIDAIRRALARLDAGTYGTCERCGDPIGAPRLRALPYATACIECAD
jgi:DnaK suppressor protein